MTKKKSLTAIPQDTPTNTAAQSEPFATADAPPASAPRSAAGIVSPLATQAGGLSDLTRLKVAWDVRHGKPPTTLYHYTSAQGLHGMLATGRVWGTNVSFLNDPSEMRYAARLIRNVMDEEAGQLKTEQKAAEEHDALLRSIIADYATFMSTHLPTWTESLLKTFEDKGDAYMSCFCTKGDLLSQWRGYGATGGGYALGFDARQISIPRSGGVRLLRVIYKPKDQKEIVRDWVRAFFKLKESLVRTMREKLDTPGIGTLLRFRAMASSAFTGKVLAAGRLTEDVPIIKHLLQQGQQVFTRFLAECLICFKDPSYQEEQEWRVIQYGQNAPEIKFRPSGPRLVPYVELALTAPIDGEAPRLPLKSITYGPTLEPAVTEKSLAMLLKHYQYEQPGIEIKKSGIPFRT